MTVWEWKKNALKRLSVSADIDAETDSSLFLCVALGIERSKIRLRAYDELTPEALVRLEEMLSRREKGEPEQYIEGETWFMGLKLKADRRALIPRFDTEVLCEAAIRDIQGLTNPRVLDLCTGSGCIAVSVAKYCSHALVTAADISVEALSQAAENAALNGVAIELVQSDGFAALTNRTFDVLLCNPPYLSAADMENMQTELTYEPRCALDGGEDGLGFYRRFCTEMGRHLSEKAVSFFEVGQGQAEDVRRIFSTVYSKAAIDTIRDLSGTERVVRMRI